MLFRSHYSFTYSYQYNWLVLIVMMLAGALIRQFFVMRHGYKLGRNRHPIGYSQWRVVGTVMVAAV